MPHRHAIRDEFSVPLDTESGQKIFRQKLNGLYEGSIVGHLATLVNSLLLAFLLWNHAPHTLLISWVSALYGITLVRFVLLRRYRTASLQPDFDSYRWFLVFAIGIGLAGAVWGSAAIWLFPEDSVPHQSFIAFVLAGMTAGAVSHYSILPAASLSFLLPALVPLMVRLLHSGGELQLAMGFMVALFIALMTFAARRMGRVIDTSLRLGHENMGLIADYAKAREITEQLNTELREELRERERSEALRRETESRLQTVINNMPIVLFAIDRDGNFTLSEGRALETLGLKPGQVVGQSAFTLYADSPEILHSLQKAMAGEVRTDTVSIGDKLAFETYYLPIRDAAGQPVGVMGVSLDVSERRVLDRLKREFISTVSHELRTPLTSIIGSLGLVSKGVAGSLPEKAAHLLGIAHDNSERLLHLINDILDIDKIESGQMVYHFSEQSLDPLLEQAAVSVQGFAERFHVRLQLHKAAPGLRARVDGRRVVQALSNLASNAIKHSTAGGAITIGLERSFREGKPVVRFTVHNQGPGIPESYRGIIFNKFTQVDASDSRQRGGTGLGLAITKAIVEQHGGAIDYRCDQEGTTFFFEIPESVTGNVVH